MQQLEFIERPTIETMPPPIMYMVENSPPYKPRGLVSSDSTLGGVVLKDVHQMHLEVVSGLKSDEDGLDIQAALRYADKNEMEIEPFLVVSIEDIIKSEKFLKQKGLGSLADKNLGLYSSYLHLILSRRDRALEEKFGMIATLRTLVHEFSHSASRHDVVTFSGTRYAEILQNRFMTRIGHRHIEYAPLESRMQNGVVAKGSFFEEALAEIHADLFANQYAIEQGIQPLEGTGLILKNVYKGKTREIWIPASHCDVAGNTRDGFEYNFNLPSLAARAYVLLDEMMDNRLWPLLNEGSRTVEGLEEHKNMISKIRLHRSVEPEEGIFDFLDGIDYTFKGFFKALHFVEQIAHHEGIDIRKGMMYSTVSKKNIILENILQN